jgi:hypothetical protein
MKEKTTVSEDEFPHTKMINLSREHLTERRLEILDVLGLTYKQYALKDMLGGLNDTEKKYQEELNAIDFLIGGIED